MKVFCKYTTVAFVGLMNASLVQSKKYENINQSNLRKLDEVVVDADVSDVPSQTPSSTPTSFPTAVPSSMPSLVKSSSPSSTTSEMASLSPSSSPSVTMSLSPSSSPSATVSFSPSSGPSAAASLSPSSSPSATVSFSPSSGPSAAASFSPSSTPSTSFPSGGPSLTPSGAPSISASPKPTVMSDSPSSSPSLSSSTTPSLSPIATVTDVPSVSSSPSFSSSSFPSSVPSTAPFAVASMLPTAIPTTSTSPTTSISPSESPEDTNNLITGLSNGEIALVTISAVLGFCAIILIGAKVCRKCAAPSSEDDVPPPGTDPDIISPKDLPLSPIAPVPEPTDTNNDVETGDVANDSVAAVENPIDLSILTTGSGHVLEEVDNDPQFSIADEESGIESDSMLSFDVYSTASGDEPSNEMMVVPKGSPGPRPKPASILVETDENPEGEEKSNPRRPSFRKSSSIVSGDIDEHTNL